MPGGHKAAFLDRDGVINRDRDYIYRKEDFEFIDGVFAACRRLHALGYKIIIVTNQSGIGRGYYTEEQFRVLNDWMLQRFADEGVTMTGVYYCPDHPEHGIGQYRRDSGHRKPGPQMLLDAAHEHKLDLAQSIMVGDKLTDIQAGRAARVGRCYLIGDKTLLPAAFQDVAAFSSLIELVKHEFGLAERP
jgi:D-glycero-D-manno-heptose 1,7-bisphosphate phosphatase